jgi:hypothetical protein
MYFYNQSPPNTKLDGDCWCTCVANATAMAFQYEWNRQGLPALNPSRLFIYFTARQLMFKKFNKPKYSPENKSLTTRVRSSVLRSRPSLRLASAQRQIGATTMIILRLSQKMTLSRRHYRIAPSNTRVSGLSRPAGRRRGPHGRSRQRYHRSHDSPSSSPVSCRRVPRCVWFPVSLISCAVLPKRVGRMAFAATADEERPRQ